MYSIEAVFTTICLEGIVFNAHIPSPSTLYGHKLFETVQDSYKICARFVQDCKGRTIVQATNYKYVYVFKFVWFNCFMHAHVL